MNKKVSEHLVLVLHDFKKPFQVRCDASGKSIGAILSQNDRHVSYFSEKLNDAKHKYSSYDQEFYAIIQALKKWKHYLMSGEFFLYTDNHTLQYIMQQPKLNRKHAKWVEYLQNFTFLIKHISGQANKVVDALSRISLVVQECKVQTLEFEFMKELYDQDSNFEAFEACKNTIHYDKGKWAELMIQDGLLFRNSQLCIPKCSMR